MADQTLAGGLIVLEGVDGVGKSTIALALAERLRASNLCVALIAFPGNDPGSVGALVHTLHHDPSQLDLDPPTAASLQCLHVAAHIDTIERRIIPALRKGDWVILDRYWWSTLVYGRATGVEPNTVEALLRVEETSWNGISPTAVFLVERPNLSRENPHRAELVGRYRALMESERDKNTIHLLENSGTVAAAVDRIVGSVIRLEQHDRHFLTTPASETQPLHDKPGGAGTAPRQLKSLAPATTTPVYDTLWRFAAERQAVFFRKFEGLAPPWTDDPILERHKFTNAYRAADRVSQYLIRNVIYAGDQSVQEVYFRTILFKLFNKIDTWQLLTRRLGTISAAEFSLAAYDRVLTEAQTSGKRIYSAAYIMPSGKSAFGHSAKHRNHLSLLARMMDDDVPKKVAEAGSMRQAFELLRAYPTIGNFLAYQFVTDLNYSEITDFAETEFVIPGPGAIDGIRKCFLDTGGLTDADTIRVVADRQELEFNRLELEFRTLGGRRLQLIDCQNLFCEVSKYARLKHPEVRGANTRTRIKQIYRPSLEPIEYWFPPKWQLALSQPRSRAKK